MELADIEGISPVMVRKDLSFFGTFGCRGVGYEVQSLKTRTCQYTGTEQKVGSGNHRWRSVQECADQLSDVKRK